MYNGILDHFGLEKNSVKTRIPEKNWKLKSIAWGLTRMQIWQLALQHFGCRTMEKSCNYKHSRRSTQKEVVKCEKFGKWEVLDSIRQKWRYFCKKPTPNPLKDGSSVVRTIWAFCHLHCWTMRSKLNNQDEVPLFVTVCDRRHHDTSLHYCAGQRRVLWTRILLKFDVGKMRQIQKPQLLIASILHLVSRVDTLPRAGEVLSRHLQHDFLFLIERRFTVVQVMYGYTVIYCYCMTVCYILRPQLVFKVSTEHDHCRSQALQS